MTENENPYQAPSVPVEPPPPAPAVDPFAAGDPGVVFMDSAGRGTAATVCIGLSALLCLVEIPILGWQYTLAGSRPLLGVNEALQGAEALVGIVALLQLLVTIGGAITFCMWFIRAYRNLLALGHGMTTHGVGWAVGGFFVPFINLVRPYQIAKEIWIGSDPASPDEMRVGGGSGIITAWWATWLLSGFTAYGGMRLTESMTRVGLFFSILSDVLTVASAFFVIKMIRGIVRRQAERHRGHRPGS
jgi:hypothetical protein